jgi:D-alanine-D-alanine ligase-like ATP-grasp enzyme
VHPGYGFLSENAEFSRRLEEEGIKFIGPKHYSVGKMGDKIASKKLAHRSQGQHHSRLQRRHRRPEKAVEIAKGIGYPVMIKASAGGGGKGLRVAFNDKEAPKASPPAERSQERLRRRPRLHREVRRRSRATSRSRCSATPTATRLPARARMLDPASSPEGDRRGAEPLHRSGDAQGDGRAGRGAGQGG